MIEIILVILAILLAPSVLAYKYIEKKEWMSSLKSGAIFTGLSMVVSFVAGFILTAATLFINLLKGIAVFALIYFILKKYLPKYAIKRPVAFFITMAVIEILLVILIIGLFSAIVITEVMSYQSILGVI